MKKQKKEEMLNSNKSPLWVAAFFFKQLKKAQILDTDISSFVDTILHREMDAVSYRMLAYLLLGVVKVYSKKVEYLLDDCNDVLVKINKFVIKTKNSTPMHMSIIIPDKFELDALDLGILEDTSKYHVAPPEQITLKEVLSNTGEFSQFSQEKFEDFGDLQFEVFGDLHFMNLDFGETSCSLDHLMEKYFHQSYQKESIERSQDDISYQEESVQHNMSSVVKESVGELIEGSTEEHDKEGKLEFQKKVSFEDGKSSVILAESRIIDETPQSKFQGSSTQRTKPGASTSESTLISTPAATEGPRFSKRRKLVIDEITVLPNKVLRKCIEDASDLISDRKKIHRLLREKQRKSFISRLPDGFYESLFPCHSKLQSLFSNTKLKIPESLQIVETLQLEDVSECQTVGIPEHIITAPQIPQRCSDSPGNEETLGNLDVLESQTYGSPDHIATAPETPPLCPKVNARTVKHPEGTDIQNSDNLGPSSLHESIEREQSFEISHNVMEEFNEETSNSSRTLEKEQSFTMDEDLNMMNEEINSPETENSKLAAGWSAQTRKVAKYLHQRFHDLGKQREADFVSLSQASKGRTRKYCAKLFYEILVLKTTNYVYVQQSKAYGDIEVRKLPKLDQTFGVEGVFK